MDTLTGSGLITPPHTMVKPTNTELLKAGLLVVKVTLIDDEGTKGVPAMDTISLVLPHTEWSDAGWSDGAPNDTSDVKISSDNVLSQNLHCRYLFIEEGKKFHIPEGVEVVISGDLVNLGGSIEGKGKLRFVSPGDTLAIDGIRPHEPRFIFDRINKMPQCIHTCIGAILFI